MIQQAIWAWIFLRFATTRGLLNTLRAMAKADPISAGLNPALYAQKQRLVRNELRRRSIIL